MKQINGYWVDENNNRWDCELYSKAEALQRRQAAIMLSKDLICLEVQNE